MILNILHIILHIMSTNNISKHFFFHENNQAVLCNKIQKFNFSSEESLSIYRVV